MQTQTQKREKISEAELSELKSLVPIWVVAQTRVPDLEQKGNEYWCRCVFHEEKTASLSMFEKEGVWVYFCHGCQEKGNIFQFLMQTDKINFGEAVKKVKEIANEENSAAQVFQPLTKSDAKVVTFHVDRLQPAELALANSAEALGWLQSRGITIDVAREFHWGFVTHPPTDSVSPDHEWFDKGWAIFPTIRGTDVLSIKYRSIQGKVSPLGDRGFVRKVNMLKPPPMYNLDGITPFDDVMIVSGELDMAVLTLAGFMAVSVQSDSTYPSLEERTRLMGANARFLSGDMDSTGQAVMTKLWRDLKHTTYLVEWPKYTSGQNAGKYCKDANECFLNLCNKDVDKFRELVIDLKLKAKQKPLASIYSIRETLRNFDVQKKRDNPRRLYFPWEKVNSWVDILPGEVAFLLASSPKSGKSTLLMNILLENALRGKVVLNYSAETNAQSYSTMIAAYLTECDRNSLDQDVAYRAGEILDAAQFYLGYQPGASFKQVLELLKDARHTFGADIVAIDPIHFLIRGAADESKAFAEASRAFVDFTIEEDVIGISVGQPTKSATSKGKIIQAQDARFSAALGEDAATVWIMHRDRKTTQIDGDAIFEPVTTLKLDYSRNSETASTKLYFSGGTCKFTQLHTT